MTHDKQETKFRLGTRRSPLAMAQAEEARDRLAAAHGIDRAHIEIVAVTASGDRIQDRPLAEIGGKALWTKELDAWQLDDLPPPDGRYRAMWKQWAGREEELYTSACRIVSDLDRPTFERIAGLKHDLLVEARRSRI